MIPAGKTVFLDANIFLYEVFDHPNFGDGSYRILKDVEEGILNGVTSTLVLDEVLFKKNKYAFDARCISPGSDAIQRRNRYSDE